MPKNHPKVSEKTKDESDGFEIDITGVFSKVKISYLLLALFIIFGFYLRYYHIEYPVIGYHNWKDAHYLTEARNFAEEGFFKFGFFIPQRDTTESIDEQIDGAHNDTFPFISIFVGILFKLFGDSLVVARLAGIFFSLATVILVYLLVKELFEREDLALVSAFLTAINPMYVFFSHNIMTVTPSLFFMILGLYLYVIWLKRQFEKRKFSMLYLGMFFIMLASASEYDFVIIAALPILVTFPYKEVFKEIKKFVTPLIITALIAALFPLWFVYSEIYVKRNIFGSGMSESVLNSYEITKLIDFSVLWDSQFWQIMTSYVADNFTLIGIFLAFLGVIFFFFMYGKNHKKLGYKFILGYIIGSVLWFFIMGFKLSGHNYHQFPVGPLVIFMMAYFMVVLSSTVASLITKKNNFNMLLKVLFILLIIIIPPAGGLYAKSMESKDRMFDTQFPGLDIAGNYIFNHKNPGDRVMHSSGQSYGFLWYADMRGYKIPSSANSTDYMARAEKDYNVSWLFVYQWGINSVFQNQILFDHIRQNYSLAQFAFIPTGQQQIQPLYFLFRKGGSFNESNLNNMLQAGIQQGRLFNQTYYYTTGAYSVMYVNIEP